MFNLKINDVLSLSQITPEQAPSIFALTDRNRQFLRQWLPWVDLTLQEKDTKAFILRQHELYVQNKAIHAAILDLAVYGLLKRDASTKIRKPS